ncbi:hypothetical protein KKE06_02535, partial [Candidatus Micrarchaeota archaeon]|nr:hypothetical protein [Candidatus Micrarchaeota archaeon]
MNPMTTTQKSVLAVSLGIIKTKLYGLISVLVLVGAWEIIANSNLVSTILLPSPSQVITALFQLMVSGELLRHVLASVFRIILGFLVSALIAFPIGIWIALSPKAHHFLAPLLNIS